MQEGDIHLTYIEVFYYDIQEQLYLPRMLLIYAEVTGTKGFPSFTERLQSSLYIYYRLVHQSFYFVLKILQKQIILSLQFCK